MDEIKKLNLMGSEITFRVSETYKPKKHCVYLDNGFCDKCTCDKCCGGQLVDELRAELKVNPEARLKECKCAVHARLRHTLRASGLENVTKSCTFATYKTSTAWQKKVKEIAMEYCSNDVWKTNSFFIGGQSGSGKTHICASICKALIDAGVKLKYFKWKEDGQRLKAETNDNEAFQSDFIPLVTSDVLYIDDLFKGSVTSADIDIAFKIIDRLYTSGRQLIISSERTLDDIRGFDIAIAGRIKERCGKGKYCTHLVGDEKDTRLWGNI